MKKEDVRSEGERTQTLPSTVSWNCTSAPCLYLLPPSRCPSWCPGTGPDHMSRSVFGLHRLDVVIRSTCHFPVPRLAARPLARAHPTYFIRTAARPLSLPSMAVHATRSMFPVLRLFLSFFNLGVYPCFQCSRNAIDPERSQVCTVNLTRTPQNCFVLFALCHLGRHVNVRHKIGYPYMMPYCRRC
jgi:hypothetical protein